MTRWHPVPDEPALQRAVLETVLATAAQSIRAHGAFHLVLAGGNTPREVYRSLKSARTNWSAWHIYFGDERCVPADDPRRNSRMAAEVWLDHVPLPASQIHAIPGELGAVDAARLYGETLSAVGEFDLVLLGLGEDGHTASLFPGQDWGTKPGSPDTLAVFNAPKPPAERVSLSAFRLSRTRKAIVLVSGSSKKAAMTAWRSGDTIPVSAVVPASGVDVWAVSDLLQAAPAGVLHT